jgi:hypothetical protein
LATTSGALTEFLLLILFGFGVGVPVGTTEEPKTSIATAAPLPAVAQAGV